MFGNLVSKGIGGIAKGFGKGIGVEASELIRKGAGSAITGAVMGAGGTMAYNAATGKNASVGKGAMYGALAWGGLRGGKALLGSNTKFNLDGIGKLGSKGMKWGQSAWKGLEGMDPKKGIGKMYHGYSAGTKHAIRRGLQGAVPGAMYGGIAGAGYGMFSDRESMMSGAFKGALAGAAAGAAYRNFGGGMGRFTHKSASAVNSGRPINPISS
jgi:hypothetical protein